MDEFNADTIRLSHQRFEHGAGRVGNREELAVLFLLERYAGFRKERLRLLDAKPAEHVANRRRCAAGKIRFVHLPMRDIAPPATSHEDFCAQFPRAINA